MFALIALLGKRYCWKLKKADTFFIFVHITKVSSFSLQNTLPKKYSYITKKKFSLQNSFSLHRPKLSLSIENVPPSFGQSQKALSFSQNWKPLPCFGHSLTLSKSKSEVTHSLEIEVGIKNAISKRLDLHSLDLPSLYYAWITYLRVLSSFQLIPEIENGKSFICRLHV